MTPCPVVMPLDTMQGDMRKRSRAVRAIQRGVLSSSYAVAAVVLVASTWTTLARVPAHASDRTLRAPATKPRLLATMSTVVPRSTTPKKTPRRSFFGMEERSNRRGASSAPTTSAANATTATPSTRTATHRAATAGFTGVAWWSTGASYFNVRSAPQPNASIVTTLQAGDQVQVLGAVHGGSFDGYDLWYEVRSGTKTAYVLASGIGSLNLSSSWTGVTDGDNENGVTYVVSESAPNGNAPSDGSFALGAQLTVLGTTTGAALEAGNDVWYRVSIGSYRPAYIYSAYVKFARRGVGPYPVPLLTAAASLAVDLDTFRPLYQHDATTRRAPASLVKMMTAALALDHLRPTDVMTVPAAAPSVAEAVGGTAMGLIPGERLSLHDLLYGMLLPSGNDAAFTLAERVGGSQDGFAALMNAKAATLGMHDTHFVQGYGLDAASQYSTAWDLARLARSNLARYSLFRDIVGTAHHVVGQGLFHHAFDLYNTNQLLGVYPGAFGVKTGTTPNAGENVIGAVKRDSHRVLVVIMGATDRYADATALLNYAVATDPTKPALQRRPAGRVSSRS